MKISNSVFCEVRCLVIFFFNVSLHFVGRLTLSSSLVSVVCDKKVSRASVC